MGLAEIVRRFALPLVLAAGIGSGSSGCSYYKHVPDEKIEDASEIKEDAEWTKKYRILKIGENFLITLENEPFDKMSADELVRFIHTPFEAQLYCLWLVTQDRRGISDGFMTTSLPLTHKNALEKRIDNDCTEAAVAAATLLNDDGFKPLILQMGAGRYFGLGHTVFIYKHKGRFHTIDIIYRNEKFPDGHDSVNELVRKQHPEMKWYSVYDISELYPDWKTTEKNMYSKWRFTTERAK